MTDGAYPDALLPGHRLHWYVLEHVLGQGGFGITYLAHDTNLDRRVAIKEYLPTEIARRRSDASARPLTESHAERYAWGLERFLAEARTLARFDHPNIVRVHSVFEANNTAYMVMRFEEGDNLATLLDRRAMLSEPELTDCLLPIIEGLALVHATGFIHRDIKPENIYVRRDGSPVLLDFGSARQSFGSSKTMTILVAPGYAPLEQYYGDASTQGPWTDIYALGATCYRAIAGRAPLDAVARAKGVLGSSLDLLPPAAEIGRGRYSERLLAAVDHSLQLSERDRPQRIDEWRREIVGDAIAAVAPEAPAPVAPERAASPASSALELTSGAKAPARRAPVVLGILAATGALAAIAIYIVTASPSSPLPPSAPAQAVAPVPAPPVTLEGAQAAVSVVPPAEVASATGTALVASRAVSLPVAVARPAADTVVVAKAPPAAPPAPRGTPAREPAPSTQSPRPAATETTVPMQPQVEVAKAIEKPASSMSSSTTAAAPAGMPRPAQAASRHRDEQLEAAEAALRSGDHAAAVQMLAPLAAAGVPRAQAMLGRAREERSGTQHSDFEAYVWYGMAARAGEPGARALKDRVGGKLQPAEIRQAERIIEHWKPLAEPASGAAP